MNSSENSKKSDDEDISDVPLSWIIEESQLEQYFLLVRRIGGLSLSVEEFWELDTWTTSKLLDMEKRIMDEEAKAYSNSKEYVERPDGNSEEMNDLVDEMSIEL